MALKPPDPTLLQKFQSLHSPRDVAQLFDTSLRRLNYYLYKRAVNYHVFTIPKANGSKRQIEKPLEPVIIFQKRLCSLLQAMYKPHPAVHGFVQKKGIVTNASKHVGANLIFNIDLENFFPSIHFGRIRGVFMSRPFHFPPNVAAILAHLCCYEGRLPQGAPTSPVIANLICRGLDQELYRLGQRFGARYTRFADDITFSTNRDSFSPNLAVAGEDGVMVGARLQEIIAKHDFRINLEKVRIHTRFDRQEVTGLTVNEKVNVPRAYVRNLRAALHCWQKNGLRMAEQKFATYDRKIRSSGRPSFVKHMRGKLDYLGMVRGHEDILYLRYALQYSKLHRQPMKMITVCGDAVEDVDILSYALWVVAGEDSDGLVMEQGTAFYLHGYGFVTNAHVIKITEENAELKWFLRPGSALFERYSYEVVKCDENIDLAILKSDAPVYACLRMGDSSSVAIQDPVFIGGYPDWALPSDGLRMEKGFVTRCRVLAGVRWFTTSATIEGGNSGGPVFDAFGRVIAVATTDGTAATPNGAISIQHVQQL